MAHSVDFHGFLPVVLKYALHCVVFRVQMSWKEITMDVFLSVTLAYSVFIICSRSEEILYFNAQKCGLPKAYKTNKNEDAPHSF